MAFIKPRLIDFYNIPVTQEEVDFAIPLLDEDIPLCVDPFLLWKSPSLQDQSLHTTLISTFNYFGRQYLQGEEGKAIDSIITISECQEVGLGSAENKVGKRIGQEKSKVILSIFQTIPQITQGGIEHIEEIQLLVDQISKDRISDFTCSILKSFLIDYTIDQCNNYKIPLSTVELVSVFSYKQREFVSEKVTLPINPQNGMPILFVPKRWLRYLQWINYDDYFKHSYINSEQKQDRVNVLNFNRQHYDVVQTYVKQKEKTFEDCKNDPLFKPIPVISATRKLKEILKLPTGKIGNADIKYEDLIGQLMASLLYPHLDFADEQSRTDSGVLIRDLIFYNNRSYDFLADINKDFETRQIVMEIKNVREIESENINQLNRYLNDQFGRFGIIITRNSLPRHI